MSLPLAVLDLVGMRTEESAGSAVARSVDLAQHAEDGEWSEWERTAVENRLRAAIVGSQATVKAGLEHLVAVTGADEVIAVTDTWDHEARLESYRLVAEVAEGIKMTASAVATE